MARYTYFNGTDKDGRKITCCISRFAGKPVRGIAKCSTTDTFDEQFGRYLAQARCDLKVSEKRVARAEQLYAEAVLAEKAAVERKLKMAKYLIDAKNDVVRYSAQIVELDNKTK